MKRFQFYTALAETDKFFNTSSVEVSDGALTPEEHKKLCDDALKHVQGIFPQDTITITPLSFPAEDFAGYTLEATVDGKAKSEMLEFDFGSQGIDVV